MLLYEHKKILFLFIFSSCITNSFASQAEFKEMRELEHRETPTLTLTETIERQKVEYRSAGLRDPFRKPTVEYTTKVNVPEGPIGQLPFLTVQGLIWGGSFPQAIINNKVVKEGDSIEGARIISIEKAGITIFFEGRQYNLSSPAASGSDSKRH